MYRQIGLLTIACLICGVSTHAYLASPVELRSFWDQQRPTRNAVFLSYKSNTKKQQSLDVRILPNGLWAKRIGIGSRVKTVWKWGLDSWSESATGVTKSKRLSTSWDDWVFEPNIDVLLEMTPRSFMRIRGLGKHPEGYMWIYGSHSHQSTDPWFGLIKNPIRLGSWVSKNKKVGKIEFTYKQGLQYPENIIFRRGNQADFVLSKRDVKWGQEAKDAIPRPDNILLDPNRQPHRINNDAQNAKDG